MADEELEPEGGEELAPDIQEDETPEPVREIATKLGWSPKDQFRGDPEKWKPADQFILDGGDIQRTLSKKLSSVEKQVERFGHVAEDLAQDRVRQRDEYWRAKHAEAVDLGDHELANAAVDEIRKAAVPVVQNSGPPPEVSNWVSRNEWFNTDPLAASRAREITDRLAKDGYDVQTQLAEVEKTIRRERPDLFPKAKEPPATQTGSSRKAAPSNRARGFADMPAESQQMAKDMHERNGVPLDAIAKSYWARIEREKVG